MEYQKVKAVTRMTSASEKHKKTKKERDSQWSVRFLELLVQEFEAEERVEQKDRHFDHKKENHERKEKQSAQHEQGETYDCRIVVKGEETVPLDWDSFEVTRDFSEPVLTCELYEDITDDVKSVGNWKASILYKIANAIMQDYYNNALSERAVGELFCGCYQKCTEKNRQVVVSKQQCEEILSTLYEYFLRAAARKSVALNEKEGRRFVEMSGLSWAGTTYYNSLYFYSCARMQGLLQKKCMEIAKQQGITAPAFHKIEQETQFYRAGGITFHGVFVWLQQKDNHPGNQYGMRDLSRVPPKHFVYLYRNHFYEEEKTGVRVLEEGIKGSVKKTGRSLWRRYTLENGRDYHNGMSYLLEGSLIDEQDETLYTEAMSFLQNFILYRINGCIEYLYCWQDDL